MPKLIKLTIVNAGGEFTGGSIDDSETTEQITNSINSGEFDFDAFESITDVDITEYDNFFHVYGPNLPYSDIIIEETNDVDVADDYDRNYSPVAKVSIDESDINQFSTENPYPNDFIERLNLNGLMVYSQKVEKRIHYPVIIQLDDNQELELDDIYIGSVNMDETISGDEIVDIVLHIPKDKALLYIKEYLKDDYEDEPLSDYISEIFMENHPVKETILKNHTIEPEEIEGKGEWENNYIKITDNEDSTLFEDGEY